MGYTMLGKWPIVDIFSLEVHRRNINRSLSSQGMTHTLNYSIKITKQGSYCFSEIDLTDFQTWGRGKA